MGKKKEKKETTPIEEDKRYLYIQADAAYHEAGHVMALISLELTFDHVDIIHKSNRGGHVNGKIKKNLYAVSSLLNDNIISLCGGMAQSYKNNIGDRGDLVFSCGIPDCDYAEGRLSSFWQTISYVKFKNLPLGYNICLRKLRDELFMTSRKLVVDNWAQIDLIAKELLVKRKLTHREVIVLLLENNMYDNLVAPPRIKLEPEVSKVKVD
jgi:hypothetical protein